MTKEISFERVCDIVANGLYMSQYEQYPSTSSGVTTLQALLRSMPLRDPRRVSKALMAMQSKGQIKVDAKTEIITVLDPQLIWVDDDEEE